MELNLCEPVSRSGPQKPRKWGFSMRTNVDQSRLSLARANFKPIARVLDRLSEDVEKEHGPSAVLKRRGAMQQTAQNAYAVRYSLRYPDEARLSLTFTVVGVDADLL